MKGILKVVVGMMLLLSMAGAALAVPFQISGGSLSVDWDFGGGIVSYTPAVMGAPVFLDEGDFFDVTVGTISIPASLGVGTATLEVDFDMPAPAGTVSDEGDFAVVSLLFFTLGAIDFGDPETFGYDYNGATGGLMEVDFNNLAGVTGGTSVDITARITNVHDPIPEPATMVLLGFGIIGLAGISRKKFKK